MPTNQGRDIDAVFDAVSSSDMEDVAREAIWPSVHSHPHGASCLCPTVEAIARLQELGYTITKKKDYPPPPPPPTGLNSL